MSTEGVCTQEGILQIIILPRGMDLDIDEIEKYLEISIKRGIEDITTDAKQESTETNEEQDLAPLYEEDETPDITTSQEPQQDDSVNNGGATSYYDLPDGATCCNDIIMWRNMNYNQGNIFKSAFCFNQGRHTGTDDLRELNKIIYFAQQEKARLLRLKEGKQW